MKPIWSALFGFLIGAGLITVLWAPWTDHSKRDQGKRLQALSLVRQTGKTWPFTKVMHDTTGHQVVPYNRENSVHQQLQELVSTAAETVRTEMSQAESPVRSLKRINEASRFFENRLRELIDQKDDFSCTIPKTTSGKKQRSGYPDLRIEHLPSKTVAYLDPKLFEAKSINSSFRSFYYEPNQENLKVTEDALHFLLGFSHDGKTRAWTFTEAHLIDLSKITLKLKTEFSASNREIYATSSPASPHSNPATP